MAGNERNHPGEIQWEGNRQWYPENRRTYMFRVGGPQQRWGSIRVGNVRIVHAFRRRRTVSQWNLEAARNIIEHLDDWSTRKPRGEERQNNMMTRSKQDKATQTWAPTIEQYVVWRGQKGQEITNATDRGKGWNPRKRPHERWGCHPPQQNWQITHTW